MADDRAASVDLPEPPTDEEILETEARARPLPPEAAPADAMDQLRAPALAGIDPGTLRADVPEADAIDQHLLDEHEGPDIEP